MNTSQQLVSVDDISQDNAPLIYVEGGLKPFIERVRAEVSAEIPDLATRKGRERIASLAAKVSKSKAAVEKPGRDYLRHLKAMPKTVEAELREFVQAMDALRDETRKPLTEWEEAEKARTAKHEAGIARMQEVDTGDASASLIGAMIQDLDSTDIGPEWEEYEAEAHRVKASSLNALRVALAAREKHEAEQAELEELRRKQAEQEQKDREARIAQEAAEKARADADQAAQAERDAAVRREAEAKAQADAREQMLKDQAAQAERDRIAAHERAEQAERDAQAKAVAAAETERQRIAAVNAEFERQAKAREEDIAHKTSVLTEIKESFMQAGITEDQAHAIVNMIRTGNVPRVSIQY